MSLYLALVPAVSAATSQVLSTESPVHDHGQRRGDTYLIERSVIFNEEMVGGRVRVTTDEERVLRGDRT